METKITSLPIPPAESRDINAGPGSKISLIDLLKNGKFSLLKANKEFLKTTDQWDTNAAAEAALAIERFTLHGRRILFDALNTRKNLIPLYAADRLEKYVIASFDSRLVNDFLFVPQLQNPDEFLIKLAQIRLLESCRYGLEKFVLQGGSFSLHTMTWLLSSLNTARELFVLIQILLIQARLKNNKDDFSETRYLLRHALGTCRALRIDVRVEMFTALNSLFPQKELAFNSRKIRLSEESILYYFDSVDEFMNLLYQTLQLPKVVQNRDFCLWLAGLDQDSEPGFKKKFKSQYLKIWNLISNTVANIA